MSDMLVTIRDKRHYVVVSVARKDDVEDLLLPADALPLHYVTSVLVGMNGSGHTAVNLYSTLTSAETFAAYSSKLLLGPCLSTDAPDISGAVKGNLHSRVDREAMRSPVRPIHWTPHVSIACTCPSQVTVDPLRRSDAKAWQLEVPRFIAERLSFPHTDGIHLLVSIAVPAWRLCSWTRPGGRSTQSGIRLIVLVLHASTVNKYRTLKTPQAGTVDRS